MQDGQKNTLLNKMNRIYVAGSAGMLGQAIYEVFNDKYTLKCTDIDINEEWITYLDFRNHTDYLNDVREFKANYLFHIGAHTDLEYCEENVDEAYSTNAMSVENAVWIANKLGIPLIYISTAGIFDGRKDIYDDYDQPNPLCVYARSKYAGEQYVEKHSKQYLILRPGWMMGGGYRKDKKFVNKIFNQIKLGKNELFVVTDKLGIPTYTRDLAKQIRVLIENEYWGLYNAACEGSTSRFEITKEILRITNLQSKIQVHAVDSTYWEKVYFAKRPPSEALLNRKLNLRKVNVMRDYKICLREYITREYHEFF